MKLSYLVEEISTKIKNFGHYKTYIIRENPEGSVKDFEEVPIYDVRLDEDGEEINLILYDISQDSHKPLPTLTLKEFYEKISSYLPKAADYFIYVSQPMINLDDEYSAHRDVPIVGHGISESNSSFGLLEKKSEE